MNMLRPLSAATLLLASCGAAAEEPVLPQLKAYTTQASWRQPVPSFPLAERSWYVGTGGISAVLIKTPQGAVLIDGGLPQAADMLLKRMQERGVQPGDLKLILLSHAHIDHAGPIAELKRRTGAQVVANAESAVLLMRGGSDDIHFGEGLVFPPVAVDRYILDEEVVELGSLRLTAHFTPGHTPGSTSWTWNDQRDGKPLRIAYVDSLSTPGYQLVNNPRYPRIADDFRHAAAVVRNLPCDLLLTPHPDASGWKPTNTNAPNPNPMSCRSYADGALSKFEAELAKQRAAPH